MAGEDSAGRPFEGGPYVQVASLCEYALVDNRGFISVMGLLDGVTHTVVAPSPPPEMPPFPFECKLVLAMKSGMAQGRHDLTIVPALPTGETLTPMKTSVIFGNGEERGVTVLTDLRLTLTMEGLHWIKVYLDNELFTQIPLRVKYGYQQVVPGSTQPV